MHDPKSSNPSPVEEGRDYYWDDGFMVFTEYYLKNRGFCCRNACRHCPWGFKKEPEDSTPTKE